MLSESRRLAGLSAALHSAEQLIPENVKLAAHFRECTHCCMRRRPKSASAVNAQDELGLAALHHAALHANLYAYEPFLYSLSRSASPPPRPVPPLPSGPPDTSEWLNIVQESSHTAVSCDCFVPLTYSHTRYSHRMHCVRYADALCDMAARSQSCSFSTARAAICSTRVVRRRCTTRRRAARPT